jgi:hypothetical protein
MTQAQERSTTENTTLATPKFTAEQVENDCPGELQDLAKYINTHLDKAGKYEDRKSRSQVMRAAVVLACPGPDIAEYSSALI